MPAITASAASRRSASRRRACASAARTALSTPPKMSRFQSNPRKALAVPPSSVSEPSSFCTVSREPSMPASALPSMVGRKPARAPRSTARDSRTRLSAVRTSGLASRPRATSRSSTGSRKPVHQASTFCAPPSTKLGTGPMNWPGRPAGPAGAYSSCCSGTSGPKQPPSTSIETKTQRRMDQSPPAAPARAPAGAVASRVTSRSSSTLSPASASCSRRRSPPCARGLVSGASAR